MAYEVPQSKKSIKQNVFEFTIEGETFEVPLMQYLPIGVAERLAEAAATGDDNAALAASLGIFGPAEGRVGKAVRTLDTEQYQALVTALSEASGVTLGESSASTSS